MLDLIEANELVKITQLLQEQNKILQKHNQEVIAYFNQNNQMLYDLNKKLYEFTTNNDKLK